MKVKSPAPYTRETVDAMRRGATASDLGWPSDRFARVARHHGIDVAAASVSRPDDLVLPKQSLPNPPGRHVHGNLKKDGNFVTTILGDEAHEYLLTEAKKRSRTKSAMIRALVEAVKAQDILPLIFGEERGA